MTYMLFVRLQCDVAMRWHTFDHKVVLKLANELLYWLKKRTALFSEQISVFFFQGAIILLFNLLTGESVHQGFQSGPYFPLVNLYKIMIR